MDFHTLDQMPCNCSAASGFKVGVAQKTELAAAFLERNYDFAANPMDVPHLVPGDADIERAAELQPAAREEQMPIPVRSPAPEADRRHEVTLIARRKRIAGLDDREIAETKTVGELGRLEYDGRLVGRI